MAWDSCCLSISLLAAQIRGHLAYRLNEKLSAVVIASYSFSSIETLLDRNDGGLDPYILLSFCACDMIPTLRLHVIEVCAPWWPPSVKA